MADDIQNIVKNLYPLEVRILLHYKKGGEFNIEKVERELGFKPGNGNPQKDKGSRLFPVRQLYFDACVCKT